MKIAIVGTGAMGSVYAGLLGKAGHEVWAIDVWQEHVDAVAAEIAPLLEPDNVVMAFQGGLGAGERVARRIPMAPSSSGSPKGSALKVALGRTAEGYRLGLAKAVTFPFEDPVRYVTDFAATIPPASRRLTMRASAPSCAVLRRPALPRVAVRLTSGPAAHRSSGRDSLSRRG